MTRETLRELVKAIWRRHLTRGAFSMKTLSDEVVTESRMRKIADPAAVEALGVADVRHVLPRLVRENRDAAIAFLSEILDLESAGLVLSKRVVVRSSHDIDRELMEADAAAGRVTGWRLAGGPVEEGERLAQAAEREVVEAKQAIHSLASGQRDLPVEVRP